MPTEKETKDQIIVSWKETQNEWKLALLNNNRKKLRSFELGNYSINHLKSFFTPISKKYYGLLEEYRAPDGDGIPEINIKLIRFDERELGAEYEYSPLMCYDNISIDKLKLPRLIRKKYE